MRWKKNHSQIAFPPQKKLPMKYATSQDGREIPKTRVLYETQVANSKYSHLLQPFLKTELSHSLLQFKSMSLAQFCQIQQDPKAWDLWEKTGPVISPDSYFRCYLVNLILGRRDVRGDNIIHNPETWGIFLKSITKA